MPALWTYVWRGRPDGPATVSHLTPLSLGPREATFTECGPGSDTVLKSPCPPCGLSVPCPWGAPSTRDALRPTWG